MEYIYGTRTMNLKDWESVVDSFALTANMLGFYFPDNKDITLDFR